MAVLERVSIGSLAQGAVPPGYTFTRSTTALYVDSDGLLKSAAINTPRRQWDATNRRWGYVGEGARTNLLLRSQEFDSASWTKTNVAVGGSTTAPNGSSDADILLEEANSSSHQTAQAHTFTAVAHTLSVMAKGVGRQWVRLMTYDGTTFRKAYFDLTNGVVGTADSGVTASMVSVGGGYYRIWMSSTVADGAGYAYICGALADGGVDDYAGDATKGYALFGAQLEAGPAPSSYIPTTTVAVTRGADLLTRALTGPEGTALSTQGTMVVEFSPKHDAVAIHSILSVDSGSVANSNGVYRYGTSASGRTLVASATQYDDGSSSVSNSVYRIALRWQLNNCRAAVNGVLADADDGASTVPTVTSIGVGAYSGGASPMGGLIYGWTIYDDAKSDAELQALTTPTTTRNQSRLTLGLGLGL